VADVEIEEHRAVTFLDFYHVKAHGHVTLSARRDKCPKKLAQLRQINQKAA